MANTTASISEPSPGKDRLGRSVPKGASETITYLNPGAAKTIYLAATRGKGTQGT